MLTNINRGCSEGLQQRRNVVLTDFVKGEDWEFTNALSVGGEKWWCEGTPSNRRRSKLQTINCYLRFFTFPLGLILRRKRFDRILAWQQFFGLNYAFFSRLLHLKKWAKLYVMTFIYKPKQGMVGRIYDRYMRYIVTSKYIDRFICFSSAECDYYKGLFGVDKFVYVPLGIEPMDVATDEICDDGYIFSTGRSNRDYSFLIDSLAYTDYKVRIACGLWQYAKELPENVTLLHNCYGKEMAREMARCHCVAIPLKDLNISSGQLVILQAMQLGKPLIVTCSQGVADYITDGENGLMMENTKKSLLACLERLNNETEYRRMSDNARAMFAEKHSLTAMAKNILNRTTIC